MLWDTLNIVMDNQFVQKFLTGGFSVLIVREFFANIKSILKERRDEVALAISLKQDINLISLQVFNFYDSMNEVIQKNQGRSINFHYIPSFNDLNLIILESNMRDSYKIFRKFGDQRSHTFLTDFYKTACNYRILLNYYREIFYGFTALQYKDDPHISFKQKSEYLNLDKIQTMSDSLNLTLDQAIQGKGFFRWVKKKYFYLPLKIFLAIFLIFIPSNESL